MNKEQVKNMENSELLAHLFNTRDNLIKIRQTMYEKPNTEGLLELFEVECKQYDLLSKEVYRRMTYGKKRH